MENKVKNNFLLLTPSSTKKILLYLLLVGLFIRALGLNFGLPFLYHVDEKRFAEISLNYLKGDLNPHFFHVPSLYTYLQAGWWGLIYLGGKLFGAFHSVEDLVKSFNANPTLFIIIGRILNLLFSLGTIALIFDLGRRMYSLRAGIWASLFLIFSHIHNKISHYSLPDVPMVFFLVLSYYFIWKIMERGQAKNYLLAGFTAGLATATKYGGQLLFLPLFLAHLFYQRRQKKTWLSILLNWPLILAGCLFIVAFFIGCPFAFLDFKAFWKDFQWQSQHLYTLGHYGGSTSKSALFFYLVYGFRENIGVLAQWLLPFGLLLGLRRPQKKDLILLSYPLLLFIIISTWKAQAVRYMLPFIPFLIIYCGSIVDRSQSFLARRLSSGTKANKIFLKNKYLLPIIFALPLLLPQAYKVIRFDLSLTQKDTRTQAREWVLDHLPSGSKIALEMYSPPLFDSGYNLLYRHTLGNVSLEFLAFRQVNFIIISDIMYHRFVTNPQDYPKQAEFYQSLEEKTVLLKEFKPQWNEKLIDLHNPTIKIYYLSSLPNYDFPGNFKQYAQRISLIKQSNKKWRISAQAQAIALNISPENVTRVFIDIISPSSDKLTRVYLDNISPSNNSSPHVGYSADLPSIKIQPQSKIFMGYEYIFDPPLPYLETFGPYEKKFLLLDGFSPESLKRNQLNLYYFYRQSPAKNGDEYFQIVTITPQRHKYRFFSQVWGGELRWGDDYLVNPSAQIKDQNGQTLFNLLIFKGKLGSFQGKKKGGAKKSMVISSLPANFKVCGSFSFYYDATLPHLAGGPVSFLFSDFFLKESNPE